MQKGFAPIVILVGILILAAAGTGYYFVKARPLFQKSCTLEAKICPDGSSVGRVGSNCEFAPCPSPKISPQDNNCEIQLNQQYGNADFVKGEVIVSFNQDVSLIKAKGLIIQNYGLIVKDSSSYNSLKILVATVPIGTEFKWVCTLKKNPSIKSAEPNNIIKIPDCSKEPC